MQAQWRTLMSLRSGLKKLKSRYAGLRERAKDTKRTVGELEEKVRRITSERAALAADKRRIEETLIAATSAQSSSDAALQAATTSASLDAQHRSKDSVLSDRLGEYNRRASEAKLALVKFQSQMLEMQGEHSRAKREYERAAREYRRTVEETKERERARVAQRQREEEAQEEAKEPLYQTTTHTTTRLVDMDSSSSSGGSSGEEDSERRRRQARARSHSPSVRITSTSTSRRPGNNEVRVTLSPDRRGAKSSSIAFSDGGAADVMARLELSESQLDSIPSRDRDRCGAGAGTRARATVDDSCIDLQRDAQGAVHVTLTSPHVSRPRRPRSVSPPLPAAPVPQPPSPPTPPPKGPRHTLKSSASSAHILGSIRPPSPGEYARSYALHTLSSSLKKQRDNIERLKAVAREAVGRCAASRKKKAIAKQKHEASKAASYNAAQTRHHDALARHEEREKMRARQRAHEAEQEALEREQAVTMRVSVEQQDAQGSSRPSSSHHRITTSARTPSPPVSSHAPSAVPVPRKSPVYVIEKHTVLSPVRRAARTTSSAAAAQPVREYRSPPSPPPLSPDGDRAYSDESSVLSSSAGPSSPSVIDSLGSTPPGDYRASRGRQRERYASSKPSAAAVAPAPVATERSWSRGRSASFPGATSLCAQEILQSAGLAPFPSSSLGGESSSTAHLLSLHQQRLAQEAAAAATKAREAEAAEQLAAERARAQAKEQAQRDRIAHYKSSRARSRERERAIRAREAEERERAEAERERRKQAERDAAAAVKDMERKEREIREEAESKRNAAVAAARAEAAAAATAAAAAAARERDQPISVSVRSSSRGRAGGEHRITLDSSIVLDDGEDGIGESSYEQARRDRTKQKARARRREKQAEAELEAAEAAAAREACAKAAAEAATEAIRRDRRSRRDLDSPGGCDDSLAGGRSRSPSLERMIALRKREQQHLASAAALHAKLEAREHARLQKEQLKAAERNIRAMVASTALHTYAWSDPRYGSYSSAVPAVPGAAQPLNPPYPYGRPPAPGYPGTYPLHPFTQPLGPHGFLSHIYPAGPQGAAGPQQQQQQQQMGGMQQQQPQQGQQQGPNSRSGGGAGSGTNPAPANALTVPASVAPGATPSIDASRPSLQRHSSYIVDASQLAPGLKTGDIYFDNASGKFLQVEEEINVVVPDAAINAAAATMLPNPAAAAGPAGTVATHGSWSPNPQPGAIPTGALAGGRSASSVQELMNKLQAQVHSVNPKLWS